MTFKELYGKTLFAGITYMRGEEVADRVQFFGNRKSRFYVGLDVLS